MATRTKTIEFAATTLSTLVDNTVTAMTTFTAYIPEFTSTVTIRKAIVMVNFMEGATQTTGNYTSRRIDVSVNGAAATSYTNANLYTGSGENSCVFYSADATTHFQTNWTTGTSKTVAISVLIDGTAVTLAWRNVAATLYITYDYDDTVTTQIKTVRIPLSTTVGALATAKPGTQLDTIPALDTELPESTKTYRNMHIVVQGNYSIVAVGTDTTVSMQIDTLTAYTTQAIEAGAASDYYLRYVYDITALGMTTNATHGWYIWANAASHNHLQAWLVVTYEFNASASNDVYVSVMLPMDIHGAMGGTTSADYQSTDRYLNIAEPGTITTKQVAFYVFWQASGNLAGLNMRIGPNHSGSFVAYTDSVATTCGCNAAMVKNTAAFTLTRGRNTLYWDGYRTDATDLGTCVSGFWIVNYTASKPTQGYGAANHTILWNLGASLDGGAVPERTILATAPIIADTSYFINSIGTNCKVVVNSTAQIGGITVLFRNDSDTEWIEAFNDPITTDPETGLIETYSQVRDYFKRWSGDTQGSRVDAETSRRWKMIAHNNAFSFFYLDLMLTYHSITYTVSGNITGTAGGSIDLSVQRYNNTLSCYEEVLANTVTGSSYSFTWFDDVESLVVFAYEDSTHKGISATGVAT